MTQCVISPPRRDSAGGWLRPLTVATVTTLRKDLLPDFRRERRSMQPCNSRSYPRNSDKISLSRAQNTSLWHFTVSQVSDMDFDGTRIPRRGCARGRADAKRSESLEVHQTEDKGASCALSSCLGLGYIRLCMRPSPSHSKGRNLQPFCSVWVERVRLSAYKALPMDPVNCFEHKQTDYTKYDELVGALQLSALELAILDCYMNGMKQARSLRRTRHQ